MFSQLLKSVRRLIASLICSLLPFTLGCTTQAKPPEETPPPATVKWEAPVQGALEEWLELIGTTVPAPDHLARVTAPVEGRVASVFGDLSSMPIAEGQHVESGTPLVQLDATLVLAALAKAEANQVTLQELELQAKLAVDLASGEVERLKQLKLAEEKYPQGTRTLVSPVDRMKADIALKDAESKLKAASSSLVSGMKEQESLKAQLKLHVLTAPMAGRVGRIQVVRGQTLSVGTVVTEIIDLDKLIDVICYVPPSLVGQLKLGQPALTGSFDRDPSAPVAIEAEGQIVYIADQAEPETGNLVVKIRFSNSEAHLRANRVQRIRVLTKPGRECINIRESAIYSDEESPTVVVVVGVKTTTNAEGKEETTGIARRMRVVLGMRDRTLHQVEIVSVEDLEKDPAKRITVDVKDALFVVEGGQGLQTGDIVKLEVEGD